jgi:hypothetical protein
MTEFKVPPEMDLFFDRLKQIKAQVKMALDLGMEPTNFRTFLESLYQQLHELYKTEEESDEENTIVSEHGSYVTNRKCDRPE